MILIERRKQERQDKKNKDRKEKEDVSNGNSLIVIYVKIEILFFIIFQFK